MKTAPIRGFKSAMGMIASIFASAINPDRQQIQAILSRVVTRSKGTGKGQKARRGKTAELKRQSKIHRNIKARCKK